MAGWARGGAVLWGGKRAVPRAEGLVLSETNLPVSWLGVPLLRRRANVVPVEAKMVSARVRIGRVREGDDGPTARDTNPLAFDSPVLD